MQLIKKGSTEGVWFEYREEGAAAEEKPARFKVRRIPTGLDRETSYRHYGKRHEIRRKAGEIITDVEGEKVLAYQRDLAIYALVESENAEVPAEFVPTIQAEPGTMVLLDGKWTEELRRVIFSELPALARWIVEKANSLNVQAAEEEAELGKTS